MGNCVYKWITLQNYRKKKHFCCSEKHKRVRELAAATMAIQCLSSSLAMAFPSKLSTLSINSSSTPLTLSNSRSLSFSSSLSHNSFSKGTLNSLSASTAFYPCLFAQKSFIFILKYYNFTTGFS